MYIRLLSVVLAMVSITSLLLIGACSDDEGGKKNDPDETAPTITVNSPTAGAIGVSDAILAVNSTIADDEALASVVVTIGNEDTEVYTETITTFSNPMSFTYNKNITLPDDAPIGDHTLTIVATDVEGNEKTSTVALTVLPAFEEGKTTILITSVPEITGDEVFYAVGQFQGWNPGIMDNPVTKYTDSEGHESYYILLPEDAGADQGFKFVRGNDWPFGEKSLDGKEIENRKFETGADFVEMEIGGWRDHNPELSNQSGGTIIAIGGVPTSSTTIIKGEIGKSITGQNDVSSATYSIEKKDGTAFTPVAGHTNVALTLSAPDGAGKRTFSLDVNVTGAGFGLGEYNIIVRATDAEGFVAREDKTLLVVEFPCSVSGTAVVVTKTRFIVNVPTMNDKLYITGNFGGTDIWGTIDPQYELTKISDGCYYIDIAVSDAGKFVQFFREPIAWAAGDWWRGQATNTEGQETANFTTTKASDGNTVQLYYKYWRQVP